MRMTVSCQGEAMLGIKQHGKGHTPLSLFWLDLHTHHRVSSPAAIASSGTAGALHAAHL
jgi:hypothetical protein